MSVNDVPQLSILGDSQTVRLRKVWEAEDRNRKFESSCSGSGWTTRHLLQAVRRNMCNVQSTCFVFISINDIIRAIPLPTVKQNIRTILRVLIDSNKSVLLSTIPPTLSQSHRQQQSIQEVNIFIQSLNNPPTVQVIYFNRLFPPFADNDSRLYQRTYYNGKPDLIHLSEFGLRSLTRLITQRTNTSPGPAVHHPPRRTPTPATTTHLPDVAS